MRTRPTRLQVTFGLLGAGLFLVLLFLIQLGADRLVLAISNWVFGSN